MISVITCSVNPLRVAELEKNIRATIGDMPYEIIAFDNRGKNLPIAHVYNECAAKAKYPCLLFIHEDAGFVDKDWAPKIIAKLAEPDCGVIGFAGSQLMLNAPGGWNVMPKWNFMNLRENDKDLVVNVDSSKPFRQVVALDGFAMFVRRDVWSKHPFDESLLTGFHCYDVDFSLIVGSEFKNYVCCNVKPYHLSAGHFGEDWARNSWKLYSEKWRAMLPRIVPDITLDKKRVQLMEERLWFRFMKFNRRFRLNAKGIKKGYHSYPISYRHFEHHIKYYVFRKK